MVSKNDRSERYSEVEEMCDDCYDFPDHIQVLLNAQMLKSARDGHAECLRAAIVEGADLNALDVNNPSQKTALIYAAEKQHCDRIELLVKSGADVNKPDALGRFRGHHWLMGILIESGADVNLKQQIVNIPLTNEARCMIGLTALMYAATSGNIQCLELLLKSGADVNTKQPVNNYTALTYAGIRDEKLMVELLLKAESDLSGLDEALETVAQQGQEERCKYLINLGADVNVNGGCALVNAAQGGHLKCLKELIAAGADVNASGGFALMHAAQEGQVKCLMELIEAGADVNQGQAIAAAAEEGQWECIKELIKAGADVNMNRRCFICCSTFSTIMNAAHRGYDLCAKLLIEAGADVNTCMLNCVSLKTLHTLLAAGVKINQATRLGPNALTRLMDNRSERMHFKHFIREKQQMIRILHAAGETVNGTRVNILEILDFSMKINLQIPDFENVCVNMNLQRNHQETSAADEPGEPVLQGAEARPPC